MHPSKEVSSDLQEVKHEEHESIRSYIDKFNDEAIQVENLNIETSCEATSRRCRNTKFIEFLMKNSTRDYF